MKIEEVFLPEWVRRAEKNEFKKEVVILFSDVTGFTEISEKLDSEKVADFMNEIFEDLWGVITEQGGDLQNYLGDAVLVIFQGRMKEVRACKAALDISRVIRAKEYKISVSTGIAMGKANFLITGKYKKIFSIYGDVVDRAQYLESKAGPFEIMVDKPTFSRSRELFKFQKINKDFYKLIAFCKS